jgi:hypothetical protein
MHMVEGSAITCLKIDIILFRFEDQRLIKPWSELNATQAAIILIKVVYQVLLLP